MNKKILLSLLTPLIFHLTVLAKPEASSSAAKVINHSPKKSGKIFTTTEKKGAREIETPSELKNLLSEKKPLVLMVYAPWCSACKSMKGTLDTISARFHNQANVAKINADLESSKELIDLLGIEAIPTLVFRNLGVMSEDQLDGVLKAFLGDISKKQESARPEPKPSTKKVSPKKNKKTVKKK